MGGPAAAAPWILPLLEKALEALLVTLGITTTVIVGGVILSEVVDIVGDWIDIEEDEAEEILGKVGERSREKRRREGCEKCKWCEIVIQAQGNLIGPDSGSTLSLGPYFRKGRTVTTREGLTILGATHLLAEEKTSRRNFREIERLGVFAATASFIQRCPPYGLQPGEHRVQKHLSERIRYDINVFGAINAFLF